MLSAQVDESTDIGGKAQLLTLIRLIGGGKSLINFSVVKKIKDRQQVMSI